MSGREQYRQTDNSQEILLLSVFGLLSYLRTLGALVGLLYQAARLNIR